MTIEKLKKDKEMRLGIFGKFVANRLKSFL